MIPSLNDLPREFERQLLKNLGEAFSSFSCLFPRQTPSLDIGLPYLFLSFGALAF